MTDLTDTPTRATWTAFGKPQRFLYRGTHQESSRYGGHYIGRVEEVDGRLHLYDLNDIQRADIARSAKFWAAAPYELTDDGHRAT